MRSANGIHCCLNEKLFIIVQIVYQDPGNLSRFTLYIIAGTAEKRKEWIDALRTGR